MNTEVITPEDDLTFSGDFSELWSSLIRTSAELQSEYQNYLQNEESVDICDAQEKAKGNTYAARIVDLAMESLKDRVSATVDKVIELVMKVINYLRDILSSYSWRGRSMIEMGDYLIDTAAGVKDYKSAPLIEREDLLKNLQINGKMPSNLVQEYEMLIEKFAEISSSFDQDQFEAALKAITDAGDRELEISRLLKVITEIITNIAPMHASGSAGEGALFYSSRVMLGQRYIETVLPQNTDNLSKFKFKIDRKDHSINERGMKPLSIGTIVSLGRLLKEMGGDLKSVSEKNRELGNMERAIKKLSGKQLTDKDVATIMLFPKVFQSAFTSITGTVISVSMSIGELAKLSLKAHLKGEHPG